jgi:hypothetical protein
MIPSDSSTFPDPFRSIGHIPGLDADGGSIGPRRVSHRRALSPKDSESLSKQLLDSGASGVTYVLGTLDKPGQAVRGLLAGKGARSLLHLAPFAGSLGLIGEEDDTAGRDLTDSWGLTAKHDQGWGAWGTGLAADILSDPLTYMTFGAKTALTAPGKALNKMNALKGWSRRDILKGFDDVESAMRARGMTASDIAHDVDKGRRVATSAMERAVQQGGGTLRAGESLGGLFGIGLPLASPKRVWGTGQTARKVAGGLDTGFDWLKYGNPVGRSFGALFDPATGGSVDAVTQRGWARHADPKLAELQAQARDDTYGVLAGLDPLVGAGGKPEREITDTARAMAEGATDLWDHRFDPALMGQLAGTARHVNATHARQLGEARGVGIRLRDAGDDYAEYVHRSAVPAGTRDMQLGRPGSLYPTGSGSSIARDDLFRNVPGATWRVNDWFERFAGQKAIKVASVARSIKKDMVLDLQARGGTMTKALGKQFDEQSMRLAQRLRKSDPAHVSEQFGLFSHDLAGDFMQRGAQHVRTVSAARGAIGTAADTAQRYVPGSGMVPLSDLMKRLGLTTYAHDPKTGAAMEGALVELYRKLAPKGAGKVDPFLTGKKGALARAVDRYGVSERDAAAILKAYQKWATPEQLKSPLAFIDSFTNAFKALAYPIWIPAHVRNAGTAFVNNLHSGTGLGDYGAQLQVMTGRGTRDLARYNPSLAGLPPAEQADWIRRQQFRSANIFGGHNQADDIADDARLALASASTSDPLRMTPHLPGTDRAGPTGNVALDSLGLVFGQGGWGSLKALGRTARDIAADPGGVRNWGQRWREAAGRNLGIKGVLGAERDVLPAVKAGRVVGTNIEDFMRGAQWLAETRRGASPEAAAQAVHKMHFDYDRLTDFERNVMRRLVPFYTYARKNLPLQFNTMISQPAWITAQWKPFTQPTPGGDGYAPQYLASGVAIPTGPERDGKRQYVSKLGLPFEEAFERWHFRDGLPDLRATALDYMGNMNPLIKGPLEQLFDVQFHSQRRLSDLRAPAAATAIGRLFGEENPQLLAQVMANTPFTRFVTTADKLIDDRKGWAAKAANLLTGVRVTDVDTDVQRAVEMRNTLEDILRGQPHLSNYTSFYVKPEEVPQLTEEEVLLMRLYSEMQDRARAYAEQKRQEAAPAGR